MSHIEPAFHEVDVFWWFTDNGLSPYWALTALCLDEFDGHDEATMELGDGVWQVRLNYNDETGIAPRPSDAITGDRAYEFKIHAEGPDQKTADFVVSPRWDDLRKPSGEQARIPWCGGDGVQVHVQGSNLAFEEYKFILQEAVLGLAAEATFDWNRRYFNRPRDDSNIVTTELYVRLKRDYAQKLVSTDGLFYRLMHLVGDLEGSSWVYSADNTEIVGHRHAFEHGPTVATELGPDHSLGKRHKVYHPKHVRSEESDDDPLSSPKYGVAFHKSLDEAAVPWGERDELLHELEETLVNVLDWAGVPTEPDPTTFVEDDHFEISPSNRDVAHLSDPTPRLEAEQDLLLFQVLDDLSPAAKSVAKTVATDGGSTHYTDVADETGYSISRIYEAIAELGDLVESDNGTVAILSEKVRQEVAAIADHLGDIVRRTADRIAALCDVDIRGVGDSALEKWLAKYGGEFRDLTGDRDGVIRIDTVLSAVEVSQAYDYIDDVLEAGLDAWLKAGRPREEFLELRYDVRDLVSDSSKYAASPSGKVGKRIA